MAWTTPRDWVANELVTHTIMNQQIRDNLAVLSTHTHSNAAGDGSSSLTSVDTITYDHQGSDPSAPASGHGTIYFKSDGLYFRNTGGSATRLALSSDNLTVGQIVEVNTAVGYEIGVDSGEKDLGTTLTITAGGSGRYYVASATIVPTFAHSSFAGTYKFYFDGSVIETETRSAGAHSNMTFSQTVSNPAASAKVFKLSVEGSGAGSVNLQGTISIREIYTS
jgi:hypothetical protein